MLATMMIPSDDRAPIDVVVLTQPDCGLCNQAKEALDRVTTDFALRIREVDLASREGEHLAIAAGVVFPPGILLDGELFSYGRLSERKLRRELIRRDGSR